MRRAIAILAVAALGAISGATAGFGSPVGHRRVPTAVRHVELTKLTGTSSRVARDGVVNGVRARALVNDFNALKKAPRGVRACPMDRGLRRVARFKRHGDVWVATEGFCGLVSVVRDGQARPALSDSKAFRHDLVADLGTMRAKKERVPTSVHKARLTYRREPFKPVSRRRTAHGAKARALVKAFNHLKVEPPGYVTCQIAGGPTETVTFRTPKHTWVATQSPCTEVTVTRDGKSLHTLLPSRKWDNHVQAALGF